MNDKILVIQQSKWIAYTAGKRDGKGNIAYGKVLSYALKNIILILILLIPGYIFQELKFSFFIIVSLYMFLILSIPYNEVYTFDKNGISLEEEIIWNIFLSILYRSKIDKVYAFISWEEIERFGINWESKHPFILVKGLMTIWIAVGNPKLQDSGPFKKNQRMDDFWIYPKGNRDSAIKKIKIAQEIYIEHKKAE